MLSMSRFISPCFGYLLRKGSSMMKEFGGARTVVLVGPSKRDLRLDLLRGIGQWMVFLDHIRYDSVWSTLAPGVLLWRCCHSPLTRSWCGLQVASSPRFSSVFWASFSW